MRIFRRLHWDISTKLRPLLQLLRSVIVEERVLRQAQDKLVRDDEQKNKAGNKTISEIL